jgi:hypothetical protein
MRLSATTVILSAVLVSIGCGFTLILVRWISPSPSAESTRAEPASGPSDLAPAIAELRRAIEDLNRTMQARGRLDAGSPTPRESVLPAPGSQEQLELAISRLNELMHGNGEGVSAAGMAERPWKGSGCSNLLTIWQEFDAARAPDAPVGLRVLNQQLERAHVGWSRQDVIDRYGPPTHITGAPSGLVFLYNRTAEPSANGTIRFETCEGMVINSYVTP